MDAPLIVSRDIDLDVSAGELWSLIADGAGWESWLVDEAEVTVETGATGVVRDHGETREVRLDDVVAGERVSFEWWPAGRPSEASAVELVVAPAPLGAVLHVTETFPPGSMAQASAASFTWEVRALAAWAIAGSRAYA
jgi:uncharacterized protein YndB with AHSA1/START domain